MHERYSKYADIYKGLAEETLWWQSVKHCAYYTLHISPLKILTQFARHINKIKSKYKENKIEILW